MAIHRVRRAVRVKAVKPKRVKSTEPFDFKMRELLDLRMCDPEGYERKPEYVKRTFEVWLRKTKGSI